MTTRMANKRLKGMIAGRFGTQVSFAREMKISETIVSAVIRGRYLLNANEKKHWANLLGCEPKDIFMSTTKIEANSPDYTCESMSAKKDPIKKVCSNCIYQGIECFASPDGDVYECYTLREKEDVHPGLKAFERTLLSPLYWRDIGWEPLVFCTPGTTCKKWAKSWGIKSWV